MKRISKRKVMALGASLAVAGGVYASAASLGGLTTESLGAGSATVSSCDTDGVLVRPSAVAANFDGHSITSYRAENVAAACDGKNWSLSYGGVGGPGIQIASGVIDLQGGSSFQMPFTLSYPASDIHNVNLLISG